MRGQLQAPCVGGELVGRGHMEFSLLAFFGHAVCCALSYCCCTGFNKLA